MKVFEIIIKIVMTVAVLFTLNACDKKNANDANVTVPTQTTQQSMQNDGASASNTGTNTQTETPAQSSGVATGDTYNGANSGNGQNNTATNEDSSQNHTPSGNTNTGGSDNSGASGSSDNNGNTGSSDQNSTGGLDNNGSTGGQDNSATSSGNDNNGTTGGGNNQNGTDGGNDRNDTANSDNNSTTNHEQNTTGEQDNNGTTGGGLDNNGTTGGDDANTTNEEEKGDTADKIVSISIRTDKKRYVVKRELTSQCTKTPAPYDMKTAVLRYYGEATYQDGSKRELVEKATLKTVPKVRNLWWMGHEFYRVRPMEGNYSVQLSYKDLQSKPYTYEVRKDPSKLNVQTRPLIPRKLYQLDMQLIQTPESNVTYDIRLQTQGAFFASYNAYEYDIFKKANRRTEILRISPQTCQTNTYYIGYDANVTASDIVVSFSVMQSDDAFYEGYRHPDVTIPVTPTYLYPPGVAERFGAIRGVRIVMPIYSDIMPKYLHYCLIDPPQGMRLQEPTISFAHDSMSEIGLYRGTEIVWDVPTDIKEGEYYDITLEAVDDTGYVQRITFPVKVPKTTPIQTEVKNNELVVIDKTSPLYGMKLRGHNGEDISNVKLRSVGYEDVWNYHKKSYEQGYELKYIAFTIDNKPPKTDIDLPNIPYFGLHRYEYDLFSWKDISLTYTKNDDGTKTYYRNEYDDGGTKVYLFVIEDKDGKQ